GEPVSPAGSDVARLIQAFNVRVVFLPTRGSGATPWRRMIVLDTSYHDAGQTKSPARVAFIAHEMVHVLQRELGDSEFWPSGGFRPSLSRRWIGDSTNYMEVLAYIVGASVEIDLLPEHEQTKTRQLSDWLATVAGEDALNATRAVVKRYKNNSIYRQNYRVEARTPGHRIPSHQWAYWLGVIGLEDQAIEHIRNLAAMGQPKVISEYELEGGG
ncbi:MAG: hypothetical protein ACE5M4_11695, partial [Anaerolineales bacterium]